MNKKKGFNFLVKCVPAKRDRVFIKLMGLQGQSAIINKEADGKSILVWFEEDRTSAIMAINGVLLVEKKEKFKSN
jgi:hypothetical protein